MGRPFDARLSSQFTNASHEPTIVVASSSPKRLRWAEQVLGKAIGDPHIISIDGGEEEDTSDVRAIAGRKLSVARRTLYQRNGDLLSGSGPKTVISGDVRISVLTAGAEPDQNTFLISRKKPDRPEETQEMFGNMYLASKRSDVLPYFQIYAASAVGDARIGSRVHKGIQTATVQLDPEATRRLATEHGFRQYEKALKDFYDHRDFQSLTGQYGSVKVTDICSGLALTALAKMGAVVAIGDQPNSSENEENFREALRGGVSAAYVGIDPHLFKDRVPDKESFTDLLRRDKEFDLVNNSVDRALSGKK